MPQHQISNSFDHGDRQRSTIDSNRRRTTKYASHHSARDLQIDEETDANEQLPQQPPERVTEFLNPTRDPGGSRIPMR